MSCGANDTTCSVIFLKSTTKSACYDDARAVADLVESKFKKLNGKVEINSVGTVIGSHTGPGTVALFFFGDKRVD